MTFKVDDAFSKHKDLLLKDFWETNSFEGRYVIVGSQFLQKTHGIDVILQSKNDVTENKVDTKHIRGSYQNFYFEELSCPERKKPGWILKEDGWPDYIAYCFWKNCFRCYENCFQVKCEKELFPVEVYIIKFSVLRKWFLKNKNNYPLHENKFTINKTNGRLVPIKDVKESLNVKRLVVNK